MSGRPPGFDLDTVFATALKKSDPAERTAYLDQACGGDLALRTQVERLIQGLGETEDDSGSAAGGRFPARDGQNPGTGDLGRER
jgi:hypothetical protein